MSVGRPRPGRVGCERRSGIPRAGETPRLDGGGAAVVCSRPSPRCWSCRAASPSRSSPTRTCGSRCRPTSISISKPTRATQRTLDFTHITWNAGDGPLEFRPQFDPATGVATATQSLSTLTGPSTWSFVRDRPDREADDLGAADRLPLPAHRRSGSTAAPRRAASAPGGVEPEGRLLHDPRRLRRRRAQHGTATATPSPSTATDPNGVLGLSVGWGDLYDSEDAGNNIDISNLPDGTYWLGARPTPATTSPSPGPTRP